MQKVESHRDRRWDLVFFVIALVVLAADQLSKIWIRAYPGLQPIYEAGFFRIIYTKNTGAAFGLLRDQFLLLTITAFIGIILVLVFVFYFSRHYPSMDSRAGRLTLGLVLGGTLGNLIDRLRFGFVTDFISVGFWPVFNIADSAVIAGVTLFAYFFLVSSRDSDLAGPSLSK
ncbi:MAG: signal peptidase II [Dehalococcoidales bacterium]